MQANVQQGVMYILIAIQLFRSLSGADHADEPTRIDPEASTEGDILKPLTKLSFQ